MHCTLDNLPINYSVVVQLKGELGTCSQVLCKFSTITLDNYAPLCENLSHAIQIKHFTLKFVKYLKI